jgi:rhamnosyl/mannosyltransferase
MHIVHLYKDAFPPVVGGVERMIWWVAKRQAKDGDSVSILVSEPDIPSLKNLPEVENVEGVTIIRMKSVARPGGSPVCPGMTSRLRRLKPDLVHLHHPNPTSDIAYLLARTKAPLVVTYHSDVVRQKLRYKAYKPIQQMMLRSAAAIMPTSQRYLDSSEQLGKHKDRCHVVPLGVEYEGSDPEESMYTEKVALRRKSWGKRPVVLFMGVLRYYKGLDYLIQAATGVPDASFVIAGKGPERPYLERLAEELDVSDRIYFLGFVEDDELPEIHEASDIFCMPSHMRAEAFGLSMVEAMMSGLPCIACDLPTGVPEVNEHEKTGLIVPPSNPQALSEAINKLLGDEELRRKLGHQAKMKAHEQYTADQMHARVKEVYEQVVKS